MNTYSVYICDDHLLFLQSLELYFGTQGKYIYAGYADNGKKALEDIGKIDPDIILIDYHLKEENGIDLLAKIKELNKRSSCFMLTMRRDAGIRNAAKELGARGFLLKTIGAEEMIRAFDMVMEGEIDFYDSLEEKQTDQTRKLTQRELEIAKLVCQEHSSEQIAQMLNLSLHTINTHRKNILRKLSAKNAIDIMNYIRKHEGDTEKNHIP